MPVPCSKHLAKASSLSSSKSLYLRPHSASPSASPVPPGLPHITQPRLSSPPARPSRSSPFPTVLTQCELRTVRRPTDHTAPPGVPPARLPLPSAAPLRTQPHTVPPALPPPGFPQAPHRHTQAGPVPHAPHPAPHGLSHSQRQQLCSASVPPVPHTGLSLVPATFLPRCLPGPPPPLHTPTRSRSPSLRPPSVAQSRTQSPHCRPRLLTQPQTRRSSPARHLFS